MSAAPPFRVDSVRTSSAAGRESTVVSVFGEVDILTTPRLRDELIDLIAAGQHHLILDLEGVTFLDSTGLGVLVGALKRVRHVQGSMRLVCTSERLLKIFRITGLHEIFAIHKSVAQGVATADPPAQEGAAVHALP